MKGEQAYTPQARLALELLGSNIRRARKHRRMTVADLAQRVGVSETTMRSIERGRPSVQSGALFEAAVIVGVPLFDEDPRRVAREARQVRAELALMPARIDAPRGPVDDDF